MRFSPNDSKTKKKATMRKKMRFANVCLSKKDPSIPAVRCPGNFKYNPSVFVVSASAGQSSLRLMSHQVQKLSLERDLAS
jgi:hypothetical protein